MTEIIIRIRARIRTVPQERLPLFAAEKNVIASERNEAAARGLSQKGHENDLRGSPVFVKQKETVLW
ncbi:hypothetical protein [Cohnella sp. GCM10012308]|uniref:hypothetical protein n=1 Tax=Cohnella sp. GCM10012308 TaxID=3317329 RepID=UPI0036105DE1